MALLNKNATQLDQGGATKKTTNEIEAKNASAQAYTPSAVAQAQGTNANGTSEAYQSGQQSRTETSNYRYNSKAARRNSNAAIATGIMSGLTNAVNWISGLVGGEEVKNPYKEQRKEYAEAAKNNYSNMTNNKTSSSGGAQTETPTTDDASGTAVGSTGNESVTTTESNPYSAYLNSERNYQQTQLNNERNDAIQRAKLAYQKAINPYGVEAEALAASGLSANGGYGQRMNQARYNAYANAVNTANNQYQADTAALDRQLAYQQYQTDLSEKQNAYSNALNEINMTNSLMSGALSIGQRYAEWNGKNLTNEATIRQQIKNAYPNMSDELISTVIGMIQKG